MIILVVLNRFPIRKPLITLILILINTTNIITLIITQYYIKMRSFDTLENKRKCIVIGGGHRAVSVFFF